MSDAATKLAEEIKARHRRITPDADCRQTEHCSVCEGWHDTTLRDWPSDWPCDAVRAADMLLELARDGERLDWIEGEGSRGWYDVEKLRLSAGSYRSAIDAARNATREKP